MDVSTKILKKIIQEAGNVFEEITNPMGNKFGTVPIGVLGKYLFETTKTSQGSFSKRDIAETLQTVQGDVYIPIRTKLPKINRLYKVDAPPDLVQLVSGIIVPKQIIELTGMRASSYNFKNKVVFYDVQELLIDAPRN